MGIDVLSFVLGKAASGGNGNGGAVLENLPISLDFTNGNQTITAPDGYVVKSATIEKPSDLIAENIRKGKNIAGVVGTMAMPEIVENVPIELDFSNGKQEQKVAAPDGYAVKSIKIQKPADLIPENIAEGVDIAGVVGTHTGGGIVEGVCYVTFMSEDGTRELYKRAVVSGNDCGDVVSLGLIDEPTKASTNTQTFTYNGWSLTEGGSASTAALKNVTADRTVYAAFKASTRYYTVRFFDGDSLLNTMQVKYGATADYEAKKAGYKFNGWQPSNANIIADTDCYAQWADNKVINDDWATILANADSYEVGQSKDVTFTYDDGTSETIPFTIIGKKDTLLKGKTAYGTLTFMADYAVKNQSTIGTGAASFSHTRSSPMKEFLAALIAAVPSDLQSVMNETIQDSLLGDASKIYSPSVIGMFGPNYSGLPEVATIGNYTPVNQQYEWFAAGNSKVRKPINGGNGAYWTHENHSNGSGWRSFCAVSGTGGFTYFRVTTSLYVVPCFTVGVTQIT